MVAEEPPEPDEIQDGRGDTGQTRFNQLSRGLRARPRTRRWLRASLLGLAVVLYANPAAAQTATEMAVSFCTSPVYNLGLATVYIVMGFMSMAILGTIVAGGGMRSLGWISRSIGQRGGKAIVWGAVAFAIVAAALVFAGIAFMVLPAQAPSECVVFFGGG